MKRSILNGLLAGLVLAGCSGESPEKQLASAKDYLQKNDTKAAVIQIKNVLQAQPESGEARFLYGRTLLEQGDAAAAEVELRKALAASYPQDAVVPELADATDPHEPGLLAPDYPAPIVDHAQEREVALARFQALPAR